MDKREFSKKVNDLRKILNEDKYKKHTKSIKRELILYINDAKVKYVDLCPKQPNNEYFSNIIHILKKNFEQEILTDLFKISLVYKNRPENVYKKPAMKLFIVLLAYAILIYDEELLKLTFKAYTFKTYYMIHSKRFRICDPDTMLVARDKVSRRSTMAKYNFDIDAYLEDRFRNYYVYIYKYFKQKDYENSINYITVAMDYLKNNINIGIKSIADEYYKVYKQKSNTSSKQRTITNPALNIKLILQNIKRDLEDERKIIKLAVPKKLNTGVAICISKQLANEYFDYIDTITRMYFRIIMKFDIEPCTKEWYDKVDNILVAKYADAKQIKKQYDEMFSVLQNVCDVKNYFNSNLMQQRYRSFIHDIIFTQIFNVVCG